MKTCKNIILSSLAGLISCQSQASLIINEFDYDQPGTDTAEFIELLNTGTGPLALDGYSLVLINGGTGSGYRDIALDGFSLAASSYLVVCSDSSLVANCDFEHTTASSWLQNGAPDGIALYNGDLLIDSVTYEGAIAGFTEGEAPAELDSNVDVMSLARIPDGNDSNNNLADFRAACITPGSANIAGTGDCSSIAVSPVPVPAAAWLFASGLFGLGFVARRMNGQA